MFVVSAVVGLFAVASAVLGFIAEEKKLTVTSTAISTMLHCHITWLTSILILRCTSVANSVICG